MIEPSKKKKERKRIRKNEQKEKTKRLNLMQLKQQGIALVCAAILLMMGREHHNVLAHRCVK